MNGDAGGVFKLPVAGTGVWTNYVGTYNGSVATLYMNGVSVGSNSISTSLPSNPIVTIGRYTGGSFYLNGLIDDVRIYNRALSAAQIAAMYNGGK